MDLIRVIQVSKKEPWNRNAMWARPNNNGSFDLLIYSRGAWESISSSSGIDVDEVNKLIDKKLEEYPFPSGTYDTELNDNITMGINVGGLNSSTKVSDIKGKTFIQLFDDILFPTIYPTYIEPSATLSLNNYNYIQEVGSTSPNLDNNFIKSFDRGKILLNGEFKGYRSGTGDDGTIYTSESSETPSPIVIEGLTRYYCKFNYSEGPQPKDSKGNDYDAPLEAGSVNSNMLSIYGSYPVFAGTVSVNTKQSLKEWKDTIEQIIDLPAHSSSDKICFKVPKRSTLKEFTQLNTASGKYENVDIDTWLKTTEIINIQESPVTYYVYTFKSNNAQDPIRIKIKF